ncbi:MAG: hypothetical protein Q9222_000213 [Ikaeria aurantiellina]
MHDPPTTRVYTGQDQVDAWNILQINGGLSLETTAVLQKLIPTAPTIVKEVVSSQSIPFATPDGVIHSATFGQYANIFIPAGGSSTIVAVNNASPRVNAGVDEPVPRLSRWSDVVWQNWTAIAGGNANKLRYIIREQIITEETREIMEYIKVAKEDGLNLPWPGSVYDMRSDDGKALLGTVYGLGVAWLIIDHSDVLGRKIPAIRIFTVPRGGVMLYYMLVELRNTLDGP